MVFDPVAEQLLLFVKFKVNVYEELHPDPAITVTVREVELPDMAPFPVTDHE